MNILFMLFSIIICHIIADFHVQNDFMATYKQSKKWEDYSIKYKYDYIPVLLVHAFSWSFITFLPLLYTVYNKKLILEDWCIIILVNTIIHYIVDDLKCNKMKINLIVDQSLHLLQIVLSILIVYIIGG